MLVQNFVVWKWVKVCRSRHIHLMHLKVHWSRQLHRDTVYLHCGRCKRSSNTVMDDGEVSPSFFGRLIKISRFIYLGNNRPPAHHTKILTLSQTSPGFFTCLHISLLKTLYRAISPFPTAFSTLFSSPEHKVLIVSFCDRPMSGVRRVSSTISLNIFSS